MQSQKNCNEIDILKKVTPKYNLRIDINSRIISIKYLIK